MHVSVLAAESIAWLAIRPEGTYVDGTAGAGGHSALIAERLTTGRLLALDRDPSAVALARERLAPYPQAKALHGNYGRLDEILAAEGIAKIDGMLIDAGVSSMQLDTAERGFSLQHPGPLDMRMDGTEAEDAAAWLARTSQDELAETLRTFGDVQPAGRIARAIVEARGANQLNTTSDLVRAVSDALNVHGKIPQEAYTVFQAIRMAVNEELRWLERGIEQAVRHARRGGRVVVITFHSGEDRVAKNTFRRLGTAARRLHPDGRVAEVTPPTVNVLTKKPVLPGQEEIAANPRSRSAKLRAVERL